MLKNISLIVLFVFSTSCATARLNCDERCALTGMKCAGELHSNSSGGWFGSSNTSTVQCEKPKDDAEKKLIEESQLDIEEKNESASKENFITWLIGGSIAVALVVVSAIVKSQK